MLKARLRYLREIDAQRSEVPAFSGVLGKKKRGWTVFFKTKTVGQQFRWEVRKKMPFALEVWLVDNAVIFISKHSLNRTNEI